jgi:uncharacterized membrane protein
MSWIIYALLSGLLFSGYNTFVNLSSRHFPPTLILTLITGTAFIVSLFINGYLYYHNNLPKLNFTQIYQPILSGIFYSLAIISYSLVFSQKSSLIVSGLAVSLILNCFLFLISILVFGEHITLLKASSILLSIVTITLLNKA